MERKKEKTVSFLSLGCKVNSYETNAMEYLFQQAGYNIVPFSEGADISIVNTCTVTNIADRKSRQMLHRAKKMNPNSIVVAVGCYVQAAGEEIKKDRAIDLVVGNNQKKEIVSVIEEYQKRQKQSEKQEYRIESHIIALDKSVDYETLSIKHAGEKTRAYIKIQDGCNQFCSYCIIPYARGRVRSRKEEDILKEVEQLTKKGYQEIVLTGIHLSSYGIDFNQKDNLLLQLIEKLSKLQQLKRIRLGSLEPRIITSEFVQALAENEKFCPHFHLSLQSGCDETLKRMNRKYTTKEYQEKCELIRSYFELPAITTDIIVGFPCETDEEFTKTKQFLKEISFAQMHIFKYSKRRGTKAEQMEGQIEEPIKTKRSNELMQIERNMRKNYQEQFLKKEETVLIEERIEIEGEQYQIGHNERYLKLAIKEEKDYTNILVGVVVKERLTEEILLCEVI